MAPVREHENERAAGEPEQRASRQRRELDHEEERERDRQWRLQTMPGLEAQVERREHEQRDDELDPEMVRVARQRVRPKHLLRSPDGTEDVDPRLARGDRLDEQLVEIEAGLGENELDDAVDGVQADPPEERGERVPVEAHAASREQRHACHEEPEVEDELHHPLRPLRERLPRVEAVEAGEVDEREHDEERQCDERRARYASVVPLEAIPDEEHEEDGGQDVRERERAGELPLQLVERDREDRQEEEPVEHRLRRCTASRTDATRERRSPARSSAQS